MHPRWFCLQSVHFFYSCSTGRGVSLPTSTGSLQFLCQSFTKAMRGSNRQVCNWLTRPVHSRTPSPRPLAGYLNIYTCVLFIGLSVLWTIFNFVFGTREHRPCIMKEQQFPSKFCQFTTAAVKPQWHRNCSWNAAIYGFWSHGRQLYRLRKLT